MTDTGYLTPAQRERYDVCCAACGVMLSLKPKSSSGLQAFDECDCGQVVGVYSERKES